MPKERFHLLMAEEILGALTSSGAIRLLSPQERHAWLLGAIWPDHLFYDLPTFRMKRIGRALHVLEGADGLPILGQWLRTRPNPTGEIEAWALGLASHFVVDRLWHPFINRLIRPPFDACTPLALKPRDCHHFIESDLESYWLKRRGPTDGYLPLLTQLHHGEARLARLLPSFQSLLRALRISPDPSPSRLTRCLHWQNLLTRRFADRRWVQKRRLLLRYQSLQPLGALIVPDRSDLFESVHASPTRRHFLGKLIDPAFFDETVTSAADRLLALPARWR